MDFPGHFEQIFQQLNYQRLHGQLCDCVIVVGNRHFKAHRSVLAAQHDFRALFSVAEGDQTMNMIQLDSEVVTAEAFVALIDKDVHLHSHARGEQCHGCLIGRAPLSPAPELLLKAAVNIT